MIEVMVAATILVVIVMMLGMLFQQTSVAWRTGLMRSDGYMQLRAFIGAIQRDASAMIDANQIPKDLRKYGDQTFGKTEIRFYTLSGGVPTRSSDTALLEDFRGLNFIVYEDTGKRTQYRLEPGGGWTEESSNVLTPSGASADPDRPQIKATGFKFAFSDATERDLNGNVVPNQNRYPLFLTVESEVTQRGRMYDVGAECSGPDKKLGSRPTDAESKDDIRTWVQ